IDLLVRSGDILHDLQLDVRRVIGAQLQSGNYATVREVAEKAAHLRAALDLASPWAGRPIVASFSELLRTLQRMLANPLAIDSAEAAAAASLIAHYSEAQRQFDARKTRFASLREALRASWPSEWNGTDHEIRLREHIGNVEDVAEAMEKLPDLSHDRLTEG